MTTVKSLPYGCWPSPVSAEMVAGKSVRFGALQSDGGAVFWSESRPDEGGRGVIVRRHPGGGPVDVLPAPWSARSKVHEYGGGEFLARSGRVFFIEADSQDVHECLRDEPPRPVTDEAQMRFADMAFDAARNRLVAVAERSTPGDHLPQNLIVSISLGRAPDEAVTALMQSHDFYSSPRIAPDGKTLAWLAWDLPDMPWESAALYIAGLGADGAPVNARRIAGGDGSAAFQPEWSPGGDLYFVWDQSGFGELQKWDGSRVTPITAGNGELMRPHWVFSMQSYAVLDEARIAAAFIKDGETALALIDANSGEVTPLECGLRSIDALARFDHHVALIGASDLAAQAVVAVTPEGECESLRETGEAGDKPLAPEQISKGEMLRFKNAGQDIYALFYPPVNSSIAAPGDERPPLIVLVHGGPTGMADRGLKLKIQYWTSRGFAVCDLDYSGSAGYGRAYMERLNGQWGIREVEDVAALTRYLTGCGKADPGRLLISGGSAGGFTVLMALAKLDIFRAGACAYGVSDLNRLQAATHKFESGYLYRLIGATPDNCEQVFTARSPLAHADEISCPVIFFQGLDDKVVPPQQSRAMARSLRKRGVPVASREFAGEGHGFRRAETIIEVLESEYAFYAAVLSLETNQALREIEIDNWSG